ncbi:putative GTP cyclohydrolase 1 type 2 [Gottschalkia purinilytica]|uniref:GTP cyclohydrolase 1 type 2 homolog n=1 Tax=Gottschalkia purinilytica TaxID=1503 RepID=A0A0L0WCW4_GOTPU|nr:Nif3-like dinuclear metal center hexameric protein [Gottschalkia purinilytica]KNF09329.1 putative GTP cyclohydrolase 1 type 2 [Gottschalkia purinilytica]
MLVKDIISIMNRLAPNYLIDSWDNSGLQIGSMEKEVKKVLISLDLSIDTVKEAIKNNIDMIITHHPFFFSSIKTISLDDIKGKIISEIIKNDITVFSAHTNLDMCEGGINDILSDKLKLSNTKPLSRFHTDKLYKISVFVPLTHSDVVREALGDNGAGFIGNYSHCTFNTKGVGTFLPSSGTNPFIGKQGVLEKVEEEKIETIVDEHILSSVISAMIEAHPYEEVAYDVYPLNNEGESYGYGRIGELSEEVTLEQFSRTVKDTLECETIRVYGDMNNKIRKVALCGGSGSSFIKDCYRNKADVYITGDIKYHDAQLALELGLSVIDAGHYGTEKHVIDYLRKYIGDNITDDIEILVHKNSVAPFKTI